MPSTPTYWTPPSALPFSVELPGIGQLVEWGELWTVTYDDCGHAVQFPRRDLWTYAEAEAIVREHLATCAECDQKGAQAASAELPPRFRVPSPRPRRDTFGDHRLLP